MANKAVDLFLVYQFLKRLATPFDQWEAFRLGIIDRNGKVLKPSSTLKTSEEIKAWGYFDRMVANLKKLLAKVPGGSTRIASYAAALLLLKEQDNLEKLSDEEMTQLLESEVANAVGDGKVAGLGVGPEGEPPGISKIKLTKMLKRKMTDVDLKRTT
jgi:hypothetical protein